MSDRADPMKLAWNSGNLRPRVLDGNGHELPTANGSYDGSDSGGRGLVVPRGGALSVDISRRGLGIGADKAGLIDLGPSRSWVFETRRKGYYLQAVLGVPEPKQDRDETGWNWHGRIELPAVRVPLQPEPPDPATVGTRIEQLGRKMMDRPGSEASEGAARALSLLDDARVVPWYLKAMDTDSYELKFAAIDRLCRFQGDEALEGLKKGMSQANANLRLAAAQGLARSPHPDAIKLLLSLRNDSYPGVRITVLQTFGKKDAAESRKLLEEMTRDSDKAVRDEARRHLDLLQATEAELARLAEVLRKAVGGDWKIRQEGADGPVLAGLDNSHMVFPFPFDKAGQQKFRRFYGRYADPFLVYGANERYTVASSGLGGAREDVLAALGLSRTALAQAAAKVRAAHPAGGEAMWQALAALVHPGMTVPQMKVLLPPARPRPGESPQEIATLDGARFAISYPLDGAWGVQASGIAQAEASGIAQGKGQDQWVLDAQPRLRPRGDLPMVTTRPATRSATVDDEEALRGLHAMLAAATPRDWEVLPLRKGRVAPAHWPEGQGTEIVLRQTQAGPKGGAYVGVWIMDRSYDRVTLAASGSPRQRPGARELARWRGRRAFAGVDMPQSWLSWAALEKLLAASAGGADPQTRPTTGPAPSGAPSRIRRVDDVFASLKAGLVRLSPEHAELTGAGDVTVDPNGVSYSRNCRYVGKRGYEDTGQKAIAIAIEVMPVARYQEQVRKVAMQMPGHRWDRLGLVGWATLHLGKDIPPALSAKLTALLEEHLSMIDELDRPAPASATQPAGAAQAPRLLSGKQTADIRAEVAAAFAKAVEEHGRGFGDLRPAPDGRSEVAWSLVCHDDTKMGGKALNRSAAMDALVAKMAGPMARGAGAQLDRYVEAAGSFLSHEQAPYRAVACELLYRFPPEMVELGLVPAVGGLLDDRAVTFEGADIMLRSRGPTEVTPGVKLTVAEIAQRTLSTATSCVLPNGKVFQTWWQHNKDCRRRLWYWALRWRTVKPESDLAGLSADLKRFHGLAESLEALAVGLESKQVGLGDGASSDWSKPGGGLTGRLIATTDKIQRGGLIDGPFEVFLELKNVGETPVAVQAGNPFAFDMKVSDEKGGETKPTWQRGDILTPPLRWVAIAPNASHRLEVTIEAADGAKGANLDTTTEIWKLAPGRYRLTATYSSKRFFQSPGDRPPATAWKSEIALPPLAVEVVPAPPKQGEPLDALTIERIERLQRNPWAGWSAGTEAVREFVDDAKPGQNVQAYVQPDITYKVLEKDRLLIRTQQVNGKPTRQDFPVQDGTGMPRPHLTGEGAAVELAVDGANMRCRLHESKPDRIGADFGGAIITKQWVLAGHPTVLLRRESGGDWWAITSVRAGRRIGQREYTCIETRGRMAIPGGHVMTTRYLHPDVPGHLVEEIKEFYKDAQGQPNRALWMVTHERTAAVGAAAPAATAPTRAGAREGPAEWQTVAEGKLAAVAVERALYEKTGNPHFFVRARITNLTDRPIGVDLRSEESVIYPNQWGMLPTSVRGEVNERRIKPQAVDDALRARMLAAFRGEELTAVAPHGQAEYFREFNAGGRKDIEKQQANGKYLFVSMDGQLFITDGQSVENVNCSWGGGGPQTTDLILRLPITWGRVPELPGAEISLKEAIARGFAFIAACEATNDAQGAMGPSGVFHARQSFNVLRILAGSAPGVKTVELRYAYLAPPYYSQRAIRKGERVIWIVGATERPGPWTGIKPLQDTPGNRQMLLRLGRPADEGNTSGPPTTNPSAPFASATRLLREAGDDGWHITNEGAGNGHVLRSHDNAFVLFPLGHRNELQEAMMRL